MSRKSYHVSAAPNGEWSVRRGGAQRASRNFEEKSAAIEYGKTLSINNRSELVIHRKDGTIMNANSYGKKPIPQRDKR
jgi:Uncharacterized protein conserved in bacteria (DUF2188)